MASAQQSPLIVAPRVAGALSLATIDFFTESSSGRVIRRPRARLPRTPYRGHAVWSARPPERRGPTRHLEKEGWN